MSTTLTIPVGVIVARETCEGAEHGVLWYPVSVLLHAPTGVAWRELTRGPRAVTYHAATLPLELHRKETEAYRLNLADGKPLVYLVLRDTGDADWPIKVHLATASPWEVQAYGMSDGERVHSVGMPEPLAEILAVFVADHHIEEPFIKRQRTRKAAESDHAFGQEPIVVLRERMRRREAGGGDHGGE